MTQARSASQWQQNVLSIRSSLGKGERESWEHKKFKFDWISPHFLPIFEEKNESFLCRVVSCRMCVFAIYRMKDVCKWDLEIQEWCNNSEMEFDIVDLCMILLSSLSHQMQCIQNCLFWLNWVRTFFAAIHRRLDLSYFFYRCNINWNLMLIFFIFWHSHALSRHEIIIFYVLHLIISHILPFFSTTKMCARLL